MAVIGTLFPSLIFCYLRHRINGKKIAQNFENTINCIMEFMCGSVLINGVIICIRLLIKKENGNIFDALNQYSDFAIKYLLLGLLLAILFPCVEIYCKNNIVIKIKANNRGPFISEKGKRILVAVFIAILALHHFIRIFDNSFWGDEGIAILAARQTWTDMLKRVAICGHTPFHYAVVWLCSQIFGHSGITYHLASTLPYFLTIIVTLVFVWKWFGTETALILTTLDTFLVCAVTYNLEVRMYAWCQLFIFLAYLMTYKIYETRKNLYLVLMTVFSAGAIYSHYFSLASIGLLYLILFVYLIRTEWKDTWKIIVSGLSVLLLFAPWILFCYKTKGVVMSNYGIDDVKWYDCFEFIFHSKYSMILLCTFLVFFTVRVMYETGIMKITDKQEEELKKTVITLSLSPGDWIINGYTIWMLGGILAVFGTIIVSKIISALAFPIIVLRYLYSSYIIIWFLFGISVSKCRLRKLYTFILIIFIIVSCYPSYCHTIKSERECNTRLKSTLEATTHEIDKSDFIYTDIVHFAWTISEVYYPDTPRDLFGHLEYWGTEKLPELDLSIENWLFLSAPISDKIKTDLINQSVSAELVVDCGYIGTGNVWIYKIVKVDEL